MTDSQLTEDAIDDCSDAITRIDEIESRTASTSIAVFLIIGARLLLRASLKDMEDRKSS